MAIPNPEGNSLIAVSRCRASADLGPWVLL